MGDRERSIMSRKKRFDSAPSELSNDPLSNLVPNPEPGYWAEIDRRLDHAATSNVVPQINLPHVAQEPRTFSRPLLLGAAAVAILGLGGFLLLREEPKDVVSVEMAEKIADQSNKDSPVATSEPELKAGDEPLVEGGSGGGESIYGPGSDHTQPLRTILTGVKAGDTYKIVLKSSLGVTFSVVDPLGTSLGSGMNEAVFTAEYDGRYHVILSEEEDPWTDPSWFFSIVSDNGYNMSSEPPTMQPDLSEQEPAGE